MRRVGLLAQWRQTAGFTQDKLAEALGVDRSTVHRWEAGSNSPRPWQVPLLAELINRTPIEVQEALERQSGASEPVINPSGVVDLPPGELRMVLLDLERRYDRVPSSSLLADASQYFARLDRLGRQLRGGKEQQAVLALQAEAATLLGKLVWDASQRRDHAGARRYYSQAAALARRVRDPELESHAFLRSSYIDLYGTRDATTGLALAEAAVRRAVPGPSP